MCYSAHSHWSTVYSTTGFHPSNEWQESRALYRETADSPRTLPEAVVCSYLDATNEFSDIPMIEGTLKINYANDASQQNAALLRWKDISEKVEVRVFSIKTILRGFADISLIPEVKSSFFGKPESFLSLEWKFGILTSMFRCTKIWWVISQTNNFNCRVGRISEFSIRASHCEFREVFLFDIQLRPELFGNFGNHYITNLHNLGRCPWFV